MTYSAHKWLAYTFLFGAIPLLTRALLWTITFEGRVAPLAVSDVVAFGLVVHASIFNEVEHLPNKERRWQTVIVAISIVLIAVYGSLYAVAVIAEKTPALVDPHRFWTCIVIALLCSLLLCTSVLKRLSERTKR